MSELKEIYAHNDILYTQNWSGTRVYAFRVLPDGSLVQMTPRDHGADANKREKPE